jgi:hypothetical protein
LAFDGLDVREGDEASCGEGGNGAGGSILGDSQAGGDISHTDRGGPTHLVWLCSEGQVLQGSPRQRTELAPPGPALGGYE